MKTVLGILLWIFVICGARADGPPSSSTHIHGWFNGTRNAAGEWCCGEGDCFMVPAEQVTELRGNYRIEWSGKVIEIVPFSEAQPSQDGQYWRCRRPDGSRRCFFFPPPAM